MERQSVKTKKAEKETVGHNLAKTDSEETEQTER